MIRLVVGGPSYRLELDARHAAQFLAFAQTVSLPRIEQRKKFGGKLRDVVTPSSIVVLGAWYEHGNPVAATRNSMFKATLATADATHLLWVDSDTSIPHESFRPIARALIELGDRPMFIVPCPQRDHRLNIWEDREHRMTRLSLDGELRPCYAGGFGAVAFNLGWYRKEWPGAPWFLDSWDPLLGYTSEDYNHCRALAERGQPPLYLGAVVDHHDRGEGKPTVERAVEAVG